MYYSLCRNKSKYITYIFNQYILCTSTGLHELIPHPIFCHLSLGTRLQGRCGGRQHSILWGSIGVHQQNHLSNKLNTSLKSKASAKAPAWAPKPSCSLSPGQPQHMRQAGTATTLPKRPWAQSSLLSHCRDLRGFSHPYTIASCVHLLAKVQALPLH